MDTDGARQEEGTRFHKINLARCNWLGAAPDFIKNAGKTTVELASDAAFGGTPGTTPPSRRGHPGLSRREWRALLGLCGFDLEAAWAFIAQGGMPSDGIIEAVDVAANGDMGLVA